MNEITNLAFIAAMLTAECALLFAAAWILERAKPRKKAGQEDPKDSMEI